MRMAKPSVPQQSSPPSARLSGAARQQRYRLARGLVSIDVSRDTASRVQALRKRTGQTTDQVIGAAAKALAASLTKKPPSSRPTSDPAKRAGSRVIQNLGKNLPAILSADQPVKVRPGTSPGDGAAKNTASRIGGAGRPSRKQSPGRRGSKPTTSHSKQQGDLDFG